MKVYTLNTPCLVASGDSNAGRAGWTGTELASVAPYHSVRPSGVAQPNRGGRRAAESVHRLVRQGRAGWAACSRWQPPDVYDACAIASTQCSNGPVTWQQKQEQNFHFHTHISRLRIFAQGRGFPCDPRGQREAASRAGKQIASRANNSMAASRCIIFAPRAGRGGALTAPSSCLSR